MLKVGDPFPEFSLPVVAGAEGDEKTLTTADLKGSPSVVYFYPKDDTSGCTTQACGFQERLAEIPGARVYGVSPDGIKSHRKFAGKFGLAFPLVADEEHVLAEACGVWGEKSMYGKKYMGILRTTFVLDADGRVATVFEGVKPAGHAAEVIAALPK